MDEKTRVERMTQRLKDHKIIAPLIVVAMVIIGLGTVAISFDAIATLFKDYIFPNNNTQTQQENVYTQNILLNSYHIQTIQQGYRVTIQLKHSKNEPLGFIAFIATIEENSNAKILKFYPTKGQNFVHRDDSQKILDNGKRAELFFQPLAVGMISLDLEVSGKTHISIEGSHNLKTFPINIL